MDDQKQMIKICRDCRDEREYDIYHRLYVACKKCASIHGVLNITKKIEKNY